MLRGKDVDEIHALRRQGLSVTTISRLTGFDRKTVRKYRQGDANPPCYGPRSQRPCKLDSYKPFVDERLRRGSGMP